MHTEIISGLEGLSGNRIKPAHIPRVQNFGKEINQVQKINDIFDSWIKNNQVLKSFIGCGKGELKMGTSSIFDGPVKSLLPSDYDDFDDNNSLEDADSLEGNDGEKPQGSPYRWKDAKDT